MYKTNKGKSPVADPELERERGGEGGRSRSQKIFFGNVVRFSEPIKLCTKLTACGCLRIEYRKLCDMQTQKFCPLINTNSYLLLLSAYL